VSLIEPRSVVTGGASGLGRAFCEELGRRRGRVLVADVDLEGAEETAERIRRLGGRARVAGCDVRSAEQVESLAEAAEGWFGDTDLLVNNAGVAVGGPVDEIPLEDWRWQVDVNLWGVIHGCHSFVPRMRKRRSGHVINVGSLAGLVSPPHLAPYNVTKAAVIALSETMHAELREEGIRVTVLCPSFFKTRIVDSSRGMAGEGQREAVVRLMERSRVQAPEVALEAIRAVVHGHLYAVPMRDARTMWRFKRLLPGPMYRVLSRWASDPGWLDRLVR